MIIWHVVIIWPNTTGTPTGKVLVFETASCPKKNYHMLGIWTKCCGLCVSTHLWTDFWVILDFGWPGLLRLVQLSPNLDSSSDGPMQCHLNTWMGQVFSLRNALLRIKNHWISRSSAPLPSAVRAWLSTVAAPRTSHPTHTSITSPLSFPLLLYYCILSLSLLHPTHTFITFPEHPTNFLLHSH